jgi:tetratricopeptide (TPR) repeat protein
MADDIEVMIADLARDPTSLVFLELGETLRRRGRLEAAVRVALTGAERHPDLLDAHDLYARVLADVGDFARARETWSSVLAREPRHIGALKGLGFLYYWAGDLDSALDHLEDALATDPTDPSVVQALMTVRAAAREEPASDTGEPDPVFAGLDGAERGILLVDDRGRILGGRLQSVAGADVSDRAAAYLAGAAQEAERTARLLELGTWQSVVAEGEGGNLHVSAPTPASLLLIVRDRGVPAGRLSMLARRAAQAARRWLEGQQL